MFSFKSSVTEVNTKIATGVARTMIDGTDFRLYEKMNEAINNGVSKQYDKHDHMK